MSKSLDETDGATDTTDGEAEGGASPGADQMDTTEVTDGAGGGGAVAI